MQVGLYHTAREPLQKSPTFRISARPTNPTPQKASATKISPSRRRPPAREKQSFQDPRSPKTSPSTSPRSPPSSRSKHSEERLRAVLGGITGTPVSVMASSNTGEKRQITMEFVHTPANVRLNLSAHHKADPAHSSNSKSKDTMTKLGEGMDIREKTRMASALHKLGINMGKEVMEHWMNHEDYDGVQFGSMSLLYQIKLKELLATIPRTIAKGNYPNKVRTALVLGIFKELSTSNVLGKFQPLLESVLSTVVDSIYVPSVRNYTDGTRLNTQDYGQFPTWFEMARSQATKIQSLEEKLKAADLLRRRFAADKKMQQALLKRTVDRWRRALLHKVFCAWSGWWKQQRRVRQLIRTVMARKYIHRDQELIRRCYIAWMAYTRSAHDQRLNQDGFSDLDAKENHDAQIEALKEQRDQALLLLKEMVVDFRQRMKELKVLFEAKMAIALSRQQTDLKNVIETCRQNAATLINFNTTCTTKSIGTQVGASNLNGGDLLETSGTTVTASKSKKIQDAPVKLNEKKKKKKKKKYKGRTLTLNKVLDIVAGMWEKKIRADMVDDAAGKDRDTLDEFALDFFVQMYGSVMKKKKMDEFKHSVQQHRTSNIRIKWFSTMVGWNEDYSFGIYTPYREDSIHAFLQVLSELFPIDAIEERLDDDPCLVNVNAALKALGTDGDGLFDSEQRRTESFSTLCRTLRENSRSVKGRSSTDRFIEFDLVMQNVMRAWYVWKVPQTADKDEKKIGAKEKVEGTVAEEDNDTKLSLSLAENNKDGTQNID